MCHAPGSDQGAFIRVILYHIRYYERQKILLGDGNRARPELNKLDSDLKARSLWTRSLSPGLNRILLDQKEKMESIAWKNMDKLQCQ